MVHAAAFGREAHRTSQRQRLRVKREAFAQRASVSESARASSAWQRALAAARR
jgi:hypothetical protein